MAITDWCNVIPKEGRKEREREKEGEWGCVTHAVVA